jgi:hypothetical protein
MLRQYPVEPLSGIGFAGTYSRGAESSRHFDTLAGLVPAIHVFKPADRKGRPNQDYLDG